MQCQQCFKHRFPVISRWLYFKNLFNWDVLEDEKSPILSFTMNEDAAVLPQHMRQTMVERTWSGGLLQVKVFFIYLCIGLQVACGFPWTNDSYIAGVSPRSQKGRHRFIKKSWDPGGSWCLQNASLFPSQSCLPTHESPSPPMALMEPPGATVVCAKLAATQKHMMVPSLLHHQCEFWQCKAQLGLDNKYEK